MKYYYRIIGENPKGDTVYDFILPNLAEVKKWHLENRTTHVHYIYKYSNGKLKDEIYEERWGKIKTDKKNIKK